MNGRAIGHGVLPVLAALSLASCASLDASHYRTYLVENPSSWASASDIEYHGLRLHSGQIIVGDEGDADTLLMSLLGEEYSPYVHAGVLVIEHNRPYVYDAYVTVNVFIHALQDQKIESGIRRATLEEYLRSQRIVAIYEPIAIDSKRIAEFAQARHRDGTPFDVHFDWREHSSLYCTEFVAVALQAGGGALPQLTNIRQNPSLQVALDWLKVDAREIVTAQSLIRSAQRVALLSRDYSIEQLTAYFSAKRELHARFTDDQKLGNLWRWTWHGLALQPSIAEFLKASSERPQVPTAQLALEFFGEPVGKQ
jgi:hypothetical protein